MGLDVIIDKIPFLNLTLLGLWFIGPYGLLPAFLAFGFYKRKLWVGEPALYLAIVEIVWVLIQISMVGPSLLQSLIGSIALVTIYFLYRPTVIEYFEEHSEQVS